MLISDCCTAKPYFGIGFAHGVYLDEEKHYNGICGECKEHCRFIEYRNTKEISEDNNWIKCKGVVWTQQ